jgi:hypothetical protein
MNVSLRSVSMLLIVVATASAASRLFSAQKLNEPSLAREIGADPDVDRRPAWSDKKPKPMPTFSSNDRARWATVRALVDEGTYVVGKREAVTPAKQGDPVYKDSGIIFEDGWGSIDRVLHPETHVFYSSKPPLLSTLVAGLYWLLRAVFGWTMSKDPFAVVRTILFVINIVPFAIYLLLIDKWAGRFAKHGWTRLVIVAAAGFATTVTPFLITFNNHTLGAFSVLFALDALLAIWFDESRPAFAFARAGFFAAFAATNELPALAFATAVFGLLFLQDAKRTLLFAVPPASLVALAFFGTNYLAVGQWRPAYSEFGSEWYEYEGSHWKKPPAGEIKYGIDWARMHESQATYAVHVLVGHHGLFSLTPLWLLALAGMFAFAGRKAEASEETLVSTATAPGDPRIREGGPRPAIVDQSAPLPWFVAPLTLALTVVVVGFYLIRSDNYGGWTNGLRWLMWLSPLWLLVMIPVVDWLATCPRRRAFVYFLLAVSIVSAHYSPWNPWRHPWIYDLMQAYGWQGYGR